MIVVYSMCTLRDSAPSMELTPGARIRPSSRNTHTLEREKQWEGTSGVFIELLSEESKHPGTRRSAVMALTVRGAGSPVTYFSVLISMS